MIGLYDIDMWHGSKPMPNLELMKIYNYYYYIRGDRVIMLKPDSSITPFSKVFYFKEKLNTLIPKSLELNKEKKQIIGAGFYGKLPRLKNEILCLPPTYDPYDIYSYRLKPPKGYDSIKKSSLIRIETNDFAGFNKNSKNVYVADTNFLYSPGAEEFLQENKNYNFLFYYPLKAKDKETAMKFLRYGVLFNREIIIDFPYDKEFFLENLEEKFLFSCEKKANESEENYLLRIAKMGMIYKNKGKYFRLISYSTKPPAAYIEKWIRNSTKLSYKDFYKDDIKALKELNGMDSELRLLLKQDPKKININSIDLNKNL